MFIGWQGGNALPVLSDGCVGCGEVRRKQYGSDGSSVDYSVSDDPDFEKRKPLDDRDCSPLRGTCTDWRVGACKPVTQL